VVYQISIVSFRGNSFFYLIVMDLKENTVYQNYTAETPVVKWLFEVLEEFDNSERAEFIQFVTGSSKVPVEGFKGLRGSRGLQKF
jgi:HECT-domain (ubiquitin-transferase)